MKNYLLSRMFLETVSTSFINKGNAGSAIPE
jgi:hypothetical protein